MKCPYCASTDDKVLDTRKTNDGYAIRRRRECLSCHKRFTTHEVVEFETILIVKKNGSKQPYEKSKVMAGLLKACDKRPIDVKVIEQVTDKIDQRVRSLGKTEVPSIEIGNFIIDVLKDVDIIAYVRFVSVYKKFDDPQSFVDEIQSVIKKH